MAVIEASAAGGNWNAKAAWVGEVVPTAADDVILAAASGSISTVEGSNPVCRSLDALNYKATLKIASVATATLKIGTTTSNAGLCLRLGAGMTLSVTETSEIVFVGTANAEERITWAGKTPGRLTFGSAESKAKWVFQDALKTLTVSTLVKLAFGELNINGKEFDVGEFHVSGAGIKAFTAGMSIIKLRRTTGEIWATTTANTTVNTAECTIEVLSTEEQAKTFAAGSHTFGTLIIASGNLTITGSNIFTTIALNTPGAAKSTKFEKGTTQTVGNITTTAKSGSKVIVESSEAGKAFTLSKASGKVSVDWLSLKDSHATGGALWFAGANSTNVSGNEGWKFEVPTIPQALSTTQGSSATLKRSVTRNLSAVQTSGGFSRLVLGNSSTSLGVADQTSSGRQEAYKFTAATTDVVDELWFRTNAVANPGITSLVLGIFTDAAGSPGVPLGEVAVPGEPQINSWIIGRGVAIPLVAGTEYWLAWIPIGVLGKQFHYNAAAAEGAGTGNVESKASAGSFSKLTATEWEVFNQGPVGMQAIVSGPIMVRAPARMQTATQGSTPSANGVMAKILATTQGSTTAQTTSPRRILASAQEQSSPSPLPEHTTIPQALSTSQASIAVGSVVVARVLTASEGSSATSVKTITRTMMTTQQQIAIYVTEGARRFLCSQSSAAQTTIGLTRVLVATQPQDANTVLLVGRSMSPTQGQSAAIVLGVARLLLASVPQSSTCTGGFSRTQVAAQGQLAVLALSNARSRAVSITQPQSTTMRVGVDRSLIAMQETSATIVFGRLATVMLSCEQGQSASYSRTAALRLAATQMQTVLAAINITRLLNASATTFTVCRRAPAREMTVQQQQTASATSSTTGARTLTAAQSSSSLISVAVARTFSLEQPQEATMSSAIAEHILIAGKLTSSTSSATLGGDVIAASESSSVAADELVSTVGGSQQSSSIAGSELESKVS